MAVQGANGWAVFFVVVATRLWLTAVAACVGLFVLPTSVVNRVRLLKWLKAKVSKKLVTTYELSKQGPFFRLFAYCCRRVGGQRVASPCKPPLKLKAKATQTSEVEVSWLPDLPANPLHKEHYVCSWTSEVKEDSWQEVEWLQGTFAPAPKKKNDSFLPSKVLKASLSGFAPNTLLRIRMCAVGTCGRSPWTVPIQVRTLATPSPESGFEGSLSSRAPSELPQRSFRWYQTKHEVGARIPVLEDWKPKEMKVKVLPSRIEVRHSSTGPAGQVDVEILAGQLGSKVVADEVFWEIVEPTQEESRHLAITLRKAELMEKWSCFIDADDQPKLDTNLVQLYTEGNAWNELSTRDLWE
mmetsp:Transcript_11707/g.21275  ORF Transcript_11707/g.21275 Transcript_11707/m.21275 type:complete len:354 (-) Transcript_11707:65-1126(-)